MTDLHLNNPKQEIFLMAPQHTYLVTWILCVCQILLLKYFDWVLGKKKHMEGGWIFKNTMALNWRKERCNFIITEETKHLNMFEWGLLQSCIVMVDIKCQQSTKWWKWLMAIWN